MLRREYVAELFENLKTDSSKFFEKVSGDVCWTVMGTHPLAGVYHTKEDFLNHTFRRLSKVLKEGALLEVKNIFIDGDYAIVEMKSISTANNGKPFNNVYCWIVKFEENIITEVTAYVDSAVVHQVINENEQYITPK